MAQEENIISAKGIHKTYHTGTVEVLALRGIDFVVKRGEMVAVMAPAAAARLPSSTAFPGLMVSTRARW